MLNQTTEREIIENAGHDMGCWEWNVEELIERAASRGVELEGRHDEELDGVTLMDRVISDLDRGVTTCRCQVTDSSEWGVEED